MCDIEYLTLTFQNTKCSVHVHHCSEKFYLFIKMFSAREASNIIRLLLLPMNKINFVSGYVTDEEIERRERELRRALQNDKKFRVRDGVSFEVAQVNQHS